MTEDPRPAAATPDQPATPVAAAERHHALDMLRGVAVLGILIMNIYAFAMPFAAYMNPLLYGGDEWYNLGTWFATHVLADQKFMTIFSMLFGAGIVLMWERAQARGGKLAGLYYRRLFWLLVIGLLHAWFIWFGDILFYYAVVGMLVYPARKWRPRTLVIVACCLLPVALLSSYAGYWYMSDLKDRATELEVLAGEGRELSESEQATVDEWATLAPFMSPGEREVREDLEAYRGSYADALAYRLPLVRSMQVDSTLFFMIWRVGGLMLIGMALMKLGVFTAARDPGWYRKLMLAGYGLGLPLLLYSSVDLWQHGFDGLYFMQRGSIPNYIGSILIALGHVGLVMRIVQSGAMAGLMQRFAAVGRMAFTNYLAHSLVLTTIFYGHGFGLYGDVPRAAQMLFVAGMLALQLWYSPLWLRHFRFGPAEWLWRSLTYWRRQPMRRPA